MESQENLATPQSLETAEDRMALAYDRKVILADESEWNGTAGIDPESLSLWIWLEAGYSMNDVFMAFGDPTKLSVIKTVVKSNLDYDVFTEEYVGYTSLADLKMRGDKISIRLIKNP